MNNDVLVIEMEGRLDPVRVRADFREVVGEMQLMGAQGKSFIIAADPEGDPVAIKLDNILTIRNDPDAI
jgi:hypothetical protein